MFQSLKDIPEKELIPGFKGRFIHADSFTITHWEIAEGSQLPEHQHIHEQSTHVTEGVLEMCIGGETKTLKAGDLCIIPPNVVHSGKAITLCKVVDTFCPVREDYK